MLNTPFKTFLLSKSKFIVLSFYYKREWLLENETIGRLNDESYQ